MGVPSEIPPDTLLGGKFRLIQRIGRGGMGDVWVARNEATQAEVAIKTLVRSERSAVHDERFRREARLAATMSHRNVVRIFDLVDESDGTLGLVMELLRGGTLEACMRDRGPLSAMHAVAIAVPILCALHHVHQKGIVHRDVKPANVFFAVEPDGHVIPKILDFGIAKLPAAGSALTIDGSVLGTPHYMSPEQIRGQDDIDGRSDMFSFAVVLYEMLTGTRVFQRDSAAASLAAVLEHEVDPDPRIEPRLWVTLSRALAKRPYERYANCAELADALRAALDTNDEELAQAVQELRPSPTPLPESSSMNYELSPSRSRKKRPPLATFVWASAAAAGAAILAVAATLAITRHVTGDDAKTAAAAPPAASSRLPDPATSGRDAIPPPPAPTEADPPPPPPTTVAAKWRPPVQSRPTASLPPVAPPKTAAPPKKKGDPATKPDF